MKNILKLTFLLSLLVLSFSACNDDYIDGITSVNPGNDSGAPVITINYPSNGTSLNVIDPIIPITCKFKVEDDIEINDVTAFMDGVQFGYYNSFLDYRVFIEENLVYETLNTGTHVFTVVATDKAGNTTTESVTFEKAPPYTPLFANESLYMPFDGDFWELISITQAQEEGSPGFLGAAKVGSNSYVAGMDNYITFPSQGLMSSEFSASFWYKVEASASRAGIITIGADNTNRTQGFRLFREGSSSSQRIKLNVGTGSGESWNDGGLIDVTAGEWVHVAFTISSTGTVIYFNGVPMNSSVMSAPIDWTGCTSFSIGSGAPTFTYWNHLSDTSAIDDLRFFSTALSQAEVQAIADSAYEPSISAETLFMPFEGNYTNLDGGAAATAVGSPTFAGMGHNSGNAFMSATDSYLTYPIADLFGTDSFTTTFWYKVNSSPDRSGILVVGADNNRTQGFRLFREGSATSQRIKLNVGIGSGESWNDGDVIDASAGNWVFVAVSVSPTESKIYFDGVLKNTATYTTPIDWTGCSDLVIGAGGPTFSYWNHLSDLSAMDDLRIFNRVLTDAEILSLM